jgi:hypothetical protein
MTPLSPKTNRDSKFSATASPVDVFIPFPDAAVSPAIAGRSLSSHVRRLSKKNQGISRWLVLAILCGAIVAFAMIQVAVR